MYFENSPSSNISSGSIFNFYMDYVTIRSVIQILNVASLYKLDTHIIIIKLSVLPIKYF